jgi:hypothetical protein
MEVRILALFRPGDNAPVAPASLVPAPLAAVSVAAAAVAGI